jgi:hypothetical protein
MIVDVVMRINGMTDHSYQLLKRETRLMYLPLAKVKIAGIRAKNHVFTEHNPPSLLTDIRS